MYYQIGDVKLLSLGGIIEQHTIYTSHTKRKNGNVRHFTALGPFYIKLSIILGPNMANEKETPVNITNGNSSAVVLQPQPFFQFLIYQL